MSALLLESSYMVTTNKEGSEYKRGKRDELVVINWLSSLGYDVRKASPSEDKEGIDCWVNGVASDIKSQKYSDRYQVNFCFELETYSRRTRVWSPNGWFYRGLARFIYYLMEVEPSSYLLYEVDKELVKATEFDYTRTLSAKVRREQEVNGHDAIDAKSGYIRLERIGDIGRVIGHTSNIKAFMAREPRLVTRVITQTHRTTQDKPVKTGIK